MTTITLFRYGKLPSVETISRLLDGKRFSNSWITAKPGKYSQVEVFVQYWYYEDIEDSIKRVMSEDDTHEVVRVLKQNGKTKVLKRTYIFINQLTKTLEIYRGSDNKTEEIVGILEKILGTKFVQINLKSEDLQKLYNNNSLELRQVMFKNIDGLIYEILRGKYLENNEKFRQFMSRIPQTLRVISFRPKIRYLNGYNKYQITVNGDRGTVKFSSNGIFQWRPRYEIRQVVFMIAATLGLLSS